MARPPMTMVSLGCKQGNHKGCTLEGCRCPCHQLPPPEKEAQP